MSGFLQVQKNIGPKCRPVDISRDVLQDDLDSFKASSEHRLGRDERVGGCGDLRRSASAQMAGRLSASSQPMLEVSQVTEIGVFVVPITQPVFKARWLGGDVGGCAIGLAQTLVQVGEWVHTARSILQCEQMFPRADDCLLNVPRQLLYKRRRRSQSGSRYVYPFNSHS
jgi:hypothetical protein